MPSRSFFPARLALSFVLAAALLQLPFPATGRAENAPVITIAKSGGETNLALQPLAGSDGPAATRTLSEDLTTAGAFALQTGPGATATYVARGNAGGGTLQGTLSDRSGTVVLTKTYTGTPRTAAHEFADDIVLALTKQRGIAGAKIAFIATRSGHKEVYLCDLDGSNLRQITSDATISVGPSLSPGARRLAYTSYKNGYADIYVIDLATGQRQRVVKFSGTNTGAAFSPDGGRLAMSCSKDGNPELYVTDVGGGNPQRLTHTPSVESSPTWSPDGAELMYVSDAGGAPQLYRISSEGGSGRHVTTGYGYCTEPSWSPDGKRVAFSVREGGGFAVAVLELANGSVRLVAGVDAQHPAWGADSRHLVYSSGEAIILLDVPTGKKTRVVGGLGKTSEPTFSR